MAVQQHVLNWLYSVLTSEYEDVNRTYNDVSQALSHFPSLSPRTDVHTYPNGASALLLHLSGTLPAVFRGATYRYPISLWVPHNYPREAPLVYVTPTETMMVRPGQHVDPQGQVYHPYLAGWADFWDKSTIVDFLTILRDVFAKEPPVISRQTASRGPPPPASAAAPTPTPPPVPPLPQELASTTRAPSTSTAASAAPTPPTQAAAQPPQPPPKGNGLQQPPPGVVAASGNSTPSPPPVPPHPHYHGANGGVRSSWYGASPPPSHAVEAGPSSRSPDYASAARAGPPVPGRPPYQQSPLGQPPMSPSQQLRQQAYHSYDRQQQQPPSTTSPPPPPLPSRFASSDVYGVGQWSGQQPSATYYPYTPQQPQQQQQQAPQAYPPSQASPAQGPLPPWQAAQQVPYQQPPYFQQQHPQVRQKAPPPPDIMDDETPLTSPPPGNVDSSSSAPASSQQYAQQQQSQQQQQQQQQLQQPQQQPPPVPPNPEKDMLLHQLAQTLAAMRQRSRGQDEATLAGLQAQRTAMLTAAARLQQDMSDVAQLSALLTSNTDILHASLSAADAVVASSKQTPAPAIDDLLVGPTVVANQLYDLVAEERALADAVFMLGRAVERGRISPAVFAKMTRSLAREWWLKKALVRKIARGMGLASV